MSTGNVQARLEARRRTGRLDDLWPDLPAGARLAALARIRRVVTRVLAGDGRPALAAADATEVKAIGIAAFTAGLGPLLGWWSERGEIDASPEIAALLADHLRHGERRVGVLRAHTATVVRALRTVGVDPILLKGMHTGAEFFSHPSTRPASDIDFLVRPEEMTRAAEALARSGFTETESTAFARRSTWAHADASQVVRSIEIDVPDNPWTLDLHRALERWYFRGLRRDLGEAAFHTTRAIEVEGERVRVLDEPHLTAFLALHASSHLRSMQLVRLVELVWVVRADSASGRLDVGALARLLRETSTGRFVYPALALAEELAPGTVDEGLLRELGRQVSPRLRRVLEEIRAAEMGPLGERSLDVALAWADGPGELVRNALDLMWPSDESLELPATLGRRVRMAIAARRKAASE